MIALWAHQAAAADAACTELAAGGRATVVAPCGAGKTRTAAEVSRRLAPAGRVLAAVTTPAQLTHTAREWRRWLGPAAGQLISIGGSDEDGGDRPTGGTGGPPAQIVTSPAALAQLLGRGQRVSVICTHASLPMVSAAHRDHGAPAWDLLIADDAHHTAHHPAAALHHGELIPAARRLYLTATPHILDGKGANLTGLSPAVSGAIVHRLPYAAATEMGIVARYRVAAALITATEATAVTGGVRRYSTLRTAAAHLALARALTTWDLRRVIAYHDQTGPAQRFAATLPRALMGTSGSAALGGMPGAGDL